MHCPRTARAWTGAAVILALLSACERNDLPTATTTPAFSTATPDILVSTTADDGPGSLRQAMADVADGGVIGFEPALAGGRIALADVLLIGVKSVTIEGPSDDGITIDGDGVSGIFLVPRAAGLTLRNATLTGGRWSRGAILADGTVLIENSTITGNHSVDEGSLGDGYGGGIHHSGGSLTVVNSTISGNIADQQGGGISSTAFSGSITLVHSTVTGNSSPDDQAGGIYVGQSNVPLVLQNTIVAGNSALTMPNCNIVSSLSATYLGTNLLGDPDCRPRAEDIVAADPVLGSLADNGGPTRTHALLAGSPAIETAVQACATTTVDQRYVPRPQGSYCDIGAFEFEGFVTPPLAIDGGGTVSPTSGVAFVTGTITCPAPATLTIEVRLRQSQKVARVNTVIEATARTPVTCGGKKPWAVALPPATGAFKTGSGSVTATTLGAPVYLRSAEASRTVKLAWARK
jgi:large repetitive protein